ncbi:hypothetical protein OG223_25775 [Streptomyces sp. NBC_01478]|uniref:hypothetical protein n=1 Tax=Streptomyces sp. NBC_01478 TaxID=2903882 RepID=UPI002E349B79|nr:hypothetical protein [Streptomyces sp. NBC_01478]
MSGLTHFGQEVAAALAHWQNSRRSITFEKALPDGGSGARLGFVFHEGDAKHPQQKLLLKLCAGEEGAVTEPHDLEAAWQSRPPFRQGGPTFDFPERRFISQVYDPLRVGDTWLMFLDCALDARGRHPLNPLTAVSPGEGKIDVAAAVIDGVFTDWNPDRRADHDMAAQDFLAKALGHRARPTSALAGAAARLLGADLHSEFLTLPGWPRELPNPTPFAVPSPLAGLKPPTVALGRAHYDLHPGNIMVATRPELEPDSFCLVDLSRFEDEGLLLRDPVQLLLYVVCDYLPRLEEPERSVLEELLLNEDEETSHPNEGRLPKDLLYALRSLRAAPDRWRQTHRYAQPEWHPQYLLALQACALMFLTRRTETAEQQWFLRLAARACEAFRAVAVPHTQDSSTAEPTPRSLGPATDGQVADGPATDGPVAVGQVADDPAADGPVDWTRWREQVPAPGTPLALVTHECFLKPAIAREINRQAYRAMGDWLDQRSPRSRILKVDGARGSGRTWALLRSVDELHQIRKVPVFVLDPAAEADITALKAFRAAQRQPFVVVLDAVPDPDDVRAMLGPVLDEKGGGEPGLYVVTECDIPTWLQPFQETVQVGRVQIGEVQSLAEVLHSSRSGRHRMTHSEQADMSLRLRSDRPPLIGEIVRMLSSDREQEFQRYAEELHGQYQKYPTDTGKSLGLLLLMSCGTHRLPVPDGVLSEAFGLASDDLEQAHGYTTGNGQRLVWLGQRTVLDRALKKIKKRNGDDTFVKYRRESLHKALRGVDPANRLHCKFARELITKASKEDRSWLVREHRDLILSIAAKSTQGSVSTQIYAWYPLIVAIHRLDGGMLPDVRSLADYWQRGLSDELAQNLAPQPRNPAEVLHMLLTLGGDETMLHLVRRLQGASDWDVNPWADFFEMVKKFPREKEITDLLMPVLRGGIVDVPKLLHAKNTAQLFPPLVAKYGRPDDRNWLWRHLYSAVADAETASLQDRFKCSDHFADLTGRCLTQKRHDLSLRILRACLQPSTLDDAACHRFEAELEAIRRAESNDRLGVRSVEVLLPLARELPHNQAAHVWQRLLKLARAWHPDELHSLSRMSLDAVGRLLNDPQVPIKDFLPLHFSALETAIHARSLRPSDAENYLRGFLDIPETAQPELVLQLATAVVQAKDQADSSAVSRLLVDCAVQEDWQKPAVLADCLVALTDWAGTTPPVLNTALSLNPQALKRLILLLRLLPGDLDKQQRRIRHILANYPEESEREVYSVVVSELLRVSLPERADLQMGERSDGNAVDLCARAHAKTLEGDISAARSLLRRLLTIYERTGRGAHPAAMRELTKTIAGRTSGPERRCYQLVSRLQTLTPLASQ